MHMHTRTHIHAQAHTNTLAYKWQYILQRYHSELVTREDNNFNLMMNHSCSYTYLTIWLTKSCWFILLCWCTHMQLPINLFVISLLGDHWSTCYLNNIITVTVAFELHCTIIGLNQPTDLLPCILTWLIKGSSSLFLAININLSW
jgi:hypothetical protein